MALAAEQGFQWWLAVGTILRDWALVQQGRQSERRWPGCARGWPPIGPQGQSWNGPYWLALLAEAYGTVGQAEEGLSLLREALVVVEKSGERYWEAELYRLQGELLLHQTDSGCTAR